MVGCFKLIGRKDWGALPANEINPLKKPAKYVFYVNTNTSTCGSYHSCCKTIQLLQHKHMKNEGFSDICYNFLIGNNDGAYVGRGGLTQPQLPKKFASKSRKSIIIGFIGMFKDEYDIPTRMLRAASLLIDHALQHKYISYNYKPVEIFISRDTI